MKNHKYIHNHKKRNLREHRIGSHFNKENNYLV